MSQHITTEQRVFLVCHAVEMYMSNLLHESSFHLHVNRRTPCNNIEKTNFVRDIGQLELIVNQVEGISGLSCGGNLQELYITPSIFQSSCDDIKWPKPCNNIEKTNFVRDIDQNTQVWYLSHLQAVNAQTSLCICPEPSLKT